LASFQGDTAEKTGRSRRDIERDATRAKQIPQISGTIGTSLDEGAELDALAKMPSEQQTEIIRRAKSGQAVSAKQELKKTRRNEKEASLAETTRAASKTLGTKVYGVIYADPPWRFEPYSRKSGLGRAADNHYPTMTVDDIAAIQAPAAKDCVLFLWATAPMLPQALAIMQSWGFTYRSHCIWSKDRTGTGYWFRNRHELLLIGTRGDIPAPAQGDQYASVISAACGRHSEKPQAFAEMIEEMFPTLPRLEMFARSPRLGWDVWGNEAQAEERRCA
jgi:N6-adenosine-specific RNA methylase IME4